MTAKAAPRDINGNYIYSDDIIFNEQIDEEYTYNDWLLSPEKYYKKILRENQKLEQENWNY